MSELSITGKIKKFLDVESGVSAAGKEWSKQNYIVSNNDGYEGAEQIFCFEVFGEEKVEQLTKFNKIGDNVKVSFNIGTNEWKDKYFTSLKSWRVEKIDASGVADAPDEDEPLPF